MFPKRTFSILKKQLIKSLACKPNTVHRTSCRCIRKIRNIPPNQNGFNEIIDLCQDYGLSGYGPWCPREPPGASAAAMTKILAARYG